MNRVAVIGLGSISSRHRRNLKVLFPKAKLYGMSASGRIPTSSITDCDQLVSNIEELIYEDVELVIVASPAPFHAQHSIPLIEAGVPVLIEKPVTVTVDDALSIQKAVDKYKTPVAIGYCLRYLPSAGIVRALLEQNRIGRLYNANIEVGQYLPDWRPNRDYHDCVSASSNLGGGVLFELSHELDYAQWLLGPLLVQYAISRSSAELGLEVEDISDIVAVNQMWTVTTIHLDFLQRQARRQCSFVGSGGRIDWDLIQNKIALNTSRGVTVLHNEPDWDKNKMYLSMLEDFVRMIQGSKHTCISLEEAKATVLLIDDIKRKAAY